MKFDEELWKQFKSTNNLNLFLEMCKLSYRIEFFGIMSGTPDCYFPEFNNLHTVLINFARRFDIQVEGLGVVGAVNIWVNFTKGRRQFWIVVNRELGTIDVDKSIFGDRDE